MGERETWRTTAYCYKDERLVPIVGILGAERPADNVNVSLLRLACAHEDTYILSDRNFEEVERYA